MTGELRRPVDMGVGCDRWDLDGRGGRVPELTGTFWQTAPDGPGVVYGDLSWPVLPETAARTVAVRVQGPGWTRTLPVDPDGGFGAEVPVGSEGDPVRFHFLDERGRVLATDTVRVVIESE